MMKKKEQIQLAVTGVLVLVLLVLIVAGLGKGKGKKRRKAATPPQSRARVTEKKKPKAVNKKAPVSSFQSLEEAAAALTLERDPFTLKKIQSADDEDGASPALSLSLMGIAWDADNSKAIINNKIVQTGSEVDQFTVTAIHPDRVILSDGVDQVELMLDL